MARLEEVADVLADMLVKALRRHCPMRPEEVWTLAAYDATKITARTPASWDNMRKKMA